MRYVDWESSKLKKLRMTMNVWCVVCVTKKLIAMNLRSTQKIVSLKLNKERKFCN